MFEEVLVEGLSGALLGLIVASIFGLAWWSRRSSAKRDFLKALNEPERARIYRKARFDAAEHFAAFRHVLKARFKEPLTAEDVKAIERVAPDIALYCTDLCGTPIGQALETIESRVNAERARRAEKKARRELHSMGIRGDEEKM